MPIFAPAAFILAFLLAGTCCAHWVAVGDAGWHGWSRDGLHWESAVLPSPLQAANLCAVGWSGRDFVAVGTLDQSGVIVRSADGRAWTSVPLTGFLQPPTPFLAVAISRKGWLACGEQCATLQPDGSAARTLSMPVVAQSPSSLETISAAHGDGEGGGMFVLGGGTDTGGFILATPDGVRIVAHIPTERPLTGLAFGAGHFVCVGTSGSLQSSHDGLSWTPRSSAEQGDFRGIVWTGNAFLAWATHIWTSPDGLDWLRADGTWPDALSQLVFAMPHGPAVARSSAGALFFSSDLGAWQPVRWLHPAGSSATSGSGSADIGIGQARAIAFAPPL